MSAMKLIFASLALTGSVAATGQGSPAPARSQSSAGTALVTSKATTVPERLFQRDCGVCHAEGKMYPGYRSLEIRGLAQPALAKRRDLDKDMIKAVARNGLGSMPQFTPLQLSDADLETIATWLTARRK